MNAEQKRWLRIFLPHSHISKICARQNLFKTNTATGTNWFAFATAHEILQEVWWHLSPEEDRYQTTLVFWKYFWWTNFTLCCRYLKTWYWEAENLSWRLSKRPNYEQINLISINSEFDLQPNWFAFATAHEILQEVWWHLSPEEDRYQTTLVFPSEH
jgi:hypothetical protein